MMSMAGGCSCGCMAHDGAVLLRRCGKCLMGTFKTCNGGVSLIVEDANSLFLDLQVAGGEVTPEWTLDQIAGLGFGVRI